MNKVYLYGEEAKNGLKNENGEVIVPAGIYSTIKVTDQFIEVTFIEKTGTKMYKYLNFKGEEISPVMYEGSLGLFSHGLMGVKKDGKWGFIDENWEVVIPFMYDDVWHFGVGPNFYIDPDHARAELNGKGGEITRYNQVVIPFVHDGMFWDYESDH